LTFIKLEAPESVVVLKGATFEKGTLNLNISSEKQEQGVKKKVSKI